MRETVNNVVSRGDRDTAVALYRSMHGKSYSQDIVDQVLDFLTEKIPGWLLSLRNGPLPLSHKDYMRVLESDPKLIDMVKRIACNKGNNLEGVHSISGLLVIPVLNPKRLPGTYKHVKVKLYRHSLCFQFIETVNYVDTETKKVDGEAVEVEVERTKLVVQQSMTYDPSTGDLKISENFSDHTIPSHLEMVECINDILGMPGHFHID